MPNLRYELHHKICNLRYGTHGYGCLLYTSERYEVLMALLLKEIEIIAIKNDFQAKVKAVSYTHLDVYKRQLTLIVSSAMLIVSLLGLPRAMWAGIACMSVCLPFTEDGKMKMCIRDRSRMQIVFL